MTFQNLADYFEQTYLIAPHYVDGRKAAGLRDLYHAKMLLKILREFFGKSKLRESRHGDIERSRATRFARSNAQRGYARGLDTEESFHWRQRFD
jgi:hypothetical protein